MTHILRPIKVRENSAPAKSLVISRLNEYEIYGLMEELVMGIVTRIEFVGDEVLQVNESSIAPLLGSSIHALMEIFLDILKA